MHLTVFLPFFDILDPNAHPMSDRSRGDSLGHFLHRCVIFRVRVQRISVLISVTVRRECGRRAIESDAQRYAGANSTADAVVNHVLSFHPGNDSSTSQAPGRRSLCQNTVVLLWWNFVIIAFSTCLAVWHTAFGFAMYVLHDLPNNRKVCRIWVNPSIIGPLGNKKRLPSMKMKKMENFQNKMGWMGSIWSRLDTLGIRIHLSHPILELGELPNNWPSVIRNGSPVWDGNFSEQNGLDGFQMVWFRCPRH